jgi:hypothetical protein
VIVGKILREVVLEDDLKTAIVIAEENALVLAIVISCSNLHFVGATNFAEEPGTAVVITEEALNVPAIITRNINVFARGGVVNSTSGA